MSVPPSYLLIDVGNSRLKYACVSAANDVLTVQAVADVRVLAALIKKQTKVLISSVGKATIVEHITELCRTAGVECQQVHTQTQQFGIHCAYPRYQNLGIDRWLAILAARVITPLPVAILDLGTANTCDVVVGEQHLGGWIAPGFHTMKQALLSNTQKVFADQSLPASLSLGSDTPECVNLGCLAALQGFAAQAEQYLARHYQDYLILVTGGDQGLLNSQNNPRYVAVDNLVLRGLLRFL